jgi:crotonobetainyl-CoA:carnitine CoA-transferase CaiB-like acyl-CoA transferase
MEGWGLDYEALRALRPDVIQVRMPAFGLRGPWRDRVGWAQTMEQTSGMAWVTGFEDDTPETPTGPSDPLGGGHALVALLLALAHRSRTGEGMLVESPLFGAALSVTAEQVVEQSAYGTLRSREGNRGPGSPQGVYRCQGTLPDGREDRWIALAVESETQWLGLVSVLGSPDWAHDPLLSSSSGRRSRHDEIDAHLSAWCSSRTSDEIVSALWSADVPVAKVVVGQELAESPQLEAREWWSSLTHPVTGPSLHAATPARIAGLHRQLHRRPAPLLGEHNREILVELLGISEDEYQGLARDNVIGTTPIGG